MDKDDYLITVLINSLQENIITIDQLRAMLDANLISFTEFLKIKNTFIDGK